jgi:hypothetical protein
VFASKNARKNAVRKSRKQPGEKCLIFEQPPLILIGAFVFDSIFNGRELHRNLRIHNEAVEIVCGDYTVHLLIPEQVILLIELDRERMSESRFGRFLRGMRKIQRRGGARRIGTSRRGRILH